MAKKKSKKGSGKNGKKSRGAVRPRRSKNGSKAGAQKRTKKVRFSKVGTRRRGTKRRGTSRKVGKGKSRASRQKGRSHSRNRIRQAGPQTEKLVGTTEQQARKKEIGSLAEFFEEFDDYGQYEEYEGGVDYE